MKRLLVVAVTCLAAVSYAAANKNVAKPDAKPEVFYVYSDKGVRTNHYVPSGWMGDHGDLSMNDGFSKDCADGKTCIEIKYSGKATQGANWAGIFWQHPANNWGDKAGGFDLTGYKKLSFWARGAKGGEKINEIFVGGITGEHGDSDKVATGPIDLTKEWKQYTMNISEANLSHIVGGFGWAASRDYNQDGFAIYLDEIRFER